MNDKFKLKMVEQYDENMAECVYEARKALHTITAEAENGYRFIIVAMNPELKTAVVSSDYEKITELSPTQIEDAYQEFLVAASVIHVALEKLEIAVPALADRFVTELEFDGDTATTVAATKLKN